MNIDDVKFQIPPIAEGKVIPHSMQLREMQEAKEKELRRQQWKHDVRIAFLGIIGGGVMGIITSIITNLIMNAL